MCNDLVFFSRNEQSVDTTYISTYFFVELISLCSSLKFLGCACAYRSMKYGKLEGIVILYTPQGLLNFVPLA